MSEEKVSDVKEILAAKRQTSFSVINSKKRHGDRKDGQLVRDIDAMQYFTPLLYPNRCDNEAFFSDKIDLSKMDEFLKKKNEGKNGDARISPFMVIAYAAMKTIALRPKMNRFVANGLVYQRKEVASAFVIKKSLRDDAEELLVYVRAAENDTFDSVIKKVQEQIANLRSDDYVDPSTAAMQFVQKLPRFLNRFIVRVARFLDRHGKVPFSLIESDPYYSSVLLTNLGSIRIHSNYHHLTNWGTTSLFLSIGEKKIRTFYDRKGNMTLKDSIDMGMTIDERIADGFYCSKTIHLLKKLIENPELLEGPITEQVIY